MLAPTLIVGLGGSGSKIVAKVAAMVSEEQRSRISFAVLDTDANELRDIRAQNPFIYTIQTSDRHTVGEYLDKDRHARDTWFPVNRLIANKAMTEGAGQVRSISRLAFDTTIRSGNIEMLHRAVEDLYQLETEESDQALRVTVVGSLAGGTGSGLILPLSMYLKNYLQSRAQQNVSIIRGFFLLPEVFYEVIKGEGERSNLRCNAYATLREIDAFLMRGDGTLPSYYNSRIKLEFPRVDSADCEEYDIRPFDFCFLFDAQNINGNKLNSYEQYLHHAANCIYAQSIGPMNKRSNSSEDNTIHELCSTGGRSRYCGAGTSMLIYPRDDIREYVALQWAKQCVSDQWLVFDRQFKQKSIQNNDKRNHGVAVKDLDPAQDYIASVNTMAQSKDPFATYISAVCSVFSDDGTVKLSDKWTKYLNALYDFVYSSTMKGNPDIELIQEGLSSKLSSLGAESTPTRQEIVNVHSELLHYRDMAFSYTEDIARNIAYTIFNTMGDNIVTERLDFTLETHLRNTQNELMHPNAIRYFLYNVLDLMRKDAVSAENAIKELKDEIDLIEKVFDDDSTSDVVETSANYLSSGETFGERIDRFTSGGKLSSRQEDMKTRMLQCMDRIEEYRVKTVFLEVVQEGIDYVKNLCDAFQNFYITLESNVPAIDRRIAEIERKYEGIKGDAVRYVCASKVCLEEINCRMPFIGAAIQLDTKLCEGIYTKVRKYAMMSDAGRSCRNSKANLASDFFSDLFEEEILGYFKKSVSQKYNSELNIDIIDALEREAEYEHQIFNRTELDAYVKNAIDGTKTLSAPFIERPLVDDCHPISSCAYNSSLDKKDIPARHLLVNEVLQDNGGVTDNDIPNNMILFFEAIYGLCAKDMPKFAPPYNNELSPRPAGAYFKAYFERISHIKPRSTESTVISPHIDRNWHNISYLPDLDPEHHKELERYIYKAFIFGLLFEKIICGVTNGKREYKLYLEGARAEDFVVSNNTVCDTFYEILDALTINPIAVRKLNEFAEYSISRERLSNKHLSLKSSLLGTALERFKIVEYSDEVMGLFDIVMMLKVSTPSADFREDQGLDIIYTCLDIMKSYIEGISIEDEVSNNLGEFIFSQYDLLKSHLEWYETKWPNFFDSMIESINETLINTLRSIEQDDYAEKVYKDNVELRNKRLAKLRK